MQGFAFSNFDSNVRELQPAVLDRLAKMSKNINKIMVQWMWRLQVIDQDRLVTMIEKILENNKSLNYVDFSRFSG